MFIIVYNIADSKNVNMNKTNMPINFPITVGREGGGGGGGWASQIVLQLLERVKEN